MFDWQPPWPPIQISGCEWIILRNRWVDPAAVVRRIDPVGEHPAHFRVVTWASTSAERTLVGQYLTLEAADRAVRFTAGPGAPSSRSDVGYSFADRRRTFRAIGSQARLSREACGETS